MTNPVKTIAVRIVKPLVSDQVWDFLRNPRRRRATPPALTAEQSEQQALDAMDLTQLAKHFKTDKWRIHRYTPHYEAHLGHLRDKRFSLLEIGIGGYRNDGVGGASLRMWRQFFGRAQIIGLDIEDKSFVDGDRITSYRGSQVDPVILDRIFDEVGEITVVVDDGSHRPEHIRETFALLFPRLADKGIYVIEDLQTSYWPEWGGSEDPHDPNTSMALIKDLLDGLNYEEFVDESYEPTYSDLNIVGIHAYHNLVFIEKGINKEGTNRRKLLRTRYEQPE